jgi:protein-S-isoprenylcysteine O-methyltransferase Ste14
MKCRPSVTESPMPPGVPPRSCTDGWINGLGFVSLLLAIWILHRSELAPAMKAALWLLAAAGPIAVLDVLVLKVHRRPSSGLEWDEPGQFDPARVFFKLVGVVSTYGLVGTAYWAFPEYHGSFYAPFWDLLTVFGPYLAAASLPYIVLVDMRMRDPYDGFWHLGRLVLGFFSNLDRGVLANHARSWIIKGYFLPLMFVYLTDETTVIADKLAADPFGSYMAFYELGFRLSFAVDLAFAAVGYVLTFRVLDSQIRTCDPTVLGWLVALVCYQPFWSIFANLYLTFEDDFYWDVWLASQPLLKGLWGCAILASVGIYAWATVMFGCRFSNLTHRGILTNGPYRLSKHPAYLSKNLSWWLVSVPFLSDEGWEAAVRHCLLLLAINAIYFMRARTEERHLSWDPTYVAYALWMNEHGALSWLARVVPGLRYSPPADMRRSPA